MNNNYSSNSSQKIASQKSGEDFERNSIESSFKSAYPTAKDIKYRHLFDETNEDDSEDQVAVKLYGLIDKKDSPFKKRTVEPKMDEDNEFRRKCNTVCVKDFVFIEKLEEDEFQIGVSQENIETRSRSKTLCLAI